MIAAATVSVCPGPASAGGIDQTLCQSAIERSEHVAGNLPPHLLSAIAIVESGRMDDRGKSVVAWPWTIDVAGAGHFYATEQEAIAAVQAALASGVQSIDVGCMQINLQQHPRAFASLEQAFDPAANTQYAASFLQQLFRQTSSWPAAIAAYHSQTPEIGSVYGQRVAAVWPVAVRYGLTVDAKLGHSPVIAEQTVDPHHVLTPEFRAKLVEEAAFKTARDRSLGIAPLRVSLAGPFHGRSPRSHDRTQRGLLQASLGG